MGFSVGDGVSLLYSLASDVTESLTLASTSFPFATDGFW